MKPVRMCVALAALCVAEAALAAVANTYTLAPSDSSGGIAPTNAWTWADSGNWGGTDYPRLAGDAADLNAEGLSTASRFLMLPTGGIDLGGIKGRDTTSFPIILIVGDELRIDNKGYTGNVPINPGRIGGYDRTQIFATLNVKNETSGHFLLAGDWRMTNGNGKVTLSTGNIQYRADWYANSGSPVREQEFDVKEVLASWYVVEFFAPRGTSAELMGKWDLTGGSPYVKRVSGNNGTDLPAGTTVTGLGIQDGTFLKRIFNNDWLELSKPVTLTASANDLTFAAFAPSFHTVIPKWTDNAASSVGFKSNKYRPEDDLRIEIETLTAGDAGNLGNGKEFPITVSQSSFYPGTVILHDTSGAYKRVRIEKAHLELVPDVTTKFFENATGFYFKETASELRVTVTNAAKTASMHSISNFVGTLVKDGEGTLETGFEEAANAGTVVVEAGRLVLTNVSDAATATLAKLCVSNGATFALASGCALSVSSFDIQPGAVIDGAITLFVSGGVGAIPEGVTLANGAVLAVSGTDGSIVKSRPASVTPGDLGNPAFWFNTDDPEHDMEYYVEGSVTNVTRWNDCRAKSDALGDYRYMIANNLPAVLTVKSFSTDGYASLISKPCVLMERSDVSSDISKAHGMVWDSTVSGIRAVFVVRNHDRKTRNDSAAGGVLLGWWGDGLGDFARTGDPLINQTSGSENVRNGEFFVNGRSVPSDYEIGQTFDYADLGYQQVASLIEAYPTGMGASANAMGYSGNANARYAGAERIYECIVYTNELTYAERMKVREYLSAKWFGTGANVEYTSARNHLDALDASDGVGLNVSEGAVSVGKLSAGTGTFTKRGAGELAIEDCVASNATVSVEEGTLYIRSSALNRDGLPYPESVHLHLDATDTASLTFEDTDRGTGVSSWASVRGTANTATKQAGTPIYKTVPAESAGKLKPGMPIVDMGPFWHKGNGDRPDATGYLSFTGSDQLRSIFLVMGSANGGGQPIGADFGGKNFWAGGWHRCASNSAWPLDNPSTPIYAARTLPYSFGVAGTHSVVRLNGEDVAPTTTGFSGDYDMLVGQTFCNTIKSDAFACAHNRNNLGGLELGEAILSTKWHSPEETKHVEAYLRKKWFGQETEGFREASVGTLKVAAGARVEVLGDGALTVGTMECAGAVVGDVALAPDGEIVVAVGDDGSVHCIEMSGTVNLAGGGTIRVVGNVSALQLGKHPILSAETILFDGAAWTVECPSGRSGIQLRASGGVLSLYVPGGTILIIK